MQRIVNLFMNDAYTSNIKAIVNITHLLAEKKEAHP